GYAARTAPVFRADADVTGIAGRALPGRARGSAACGWGWARGRARPADSGFGGPPGLERVLHPAVGAGFHHEGEHRDHTTGNEHHDAAEAPAHAAPQVEDGDRVDHVDPAVHECHPRADHGLAEAVDLHHVLQ